MGPTWRVAFNVAVVAAAEHCCVTAMLWYGREQKSRSWVWEIDGGEPLRLCRKSLLATSKIHAGFEVSYTVCFAPLLLK